MNTHADKTSENKSQAVANSLPKLLSNDESTFQFVDNRPETIAQRKLQEAIKNSPRVKQLKACQEMANNSPQVNQLKAHQVMVDNFSSQQVRRKESVEGEPLQQMEGNVAQLVNVKVGFDGTATQSRFAGPADDLTTEGLGNCIAIVAYHRGAPSLGAVMRHYDTVKAVVALVPDAIGKGKAITFSAAAIGAVAAATAGQLVANVPAAAGNFGFAVALGGVWSNLDPDKPTWKSRFNLMNAIVAAVGVEPTIAAVTVNFDVATSRFS